MSRLSQSVLCLLASAVYPAVLTNRAVAAADGEASARG